MFNNDSDKIPEVATASIVSSENCMQIGTSASSFDSCSKNMQLHLQQSSNLPIAVQSISSKPDRLHQQLITGTMHSTQQSLAQNISGITSADTVLQSQFQSVGLMSQQSNDSLQQHMQQSQLSGSLLTENPTQGVMQGRIYGTGANSGVNSMTGIGGIGTSGGLGLFIKKYLV